WLRRFKYLSRASSRLGSKIPLRLLRAAYRGRRAVRASSALLIAIRLSVPMPARLAARRAKATQLTGSLFERCHIPNSPSINRSKHVCARSGTYVGDTVLVAALKDLPAAIAFNA